MQFYDLAATALPRTASTILDVGSGLGFGGEHLMQLHDEWRVEGLDFSRQACCNAVIKTHCVDLRTQPLPGCYDYVLAVETLEHFLDPMPVLSTLYDCARRAVVLTVPYKGGVSPTHPVDFDENSFVEYSCVKTELSERELPDATVKTDMLVVISR